MKTLIIKTKRRRSKPRQIEDEKGMPLVFEAENTSVDETALTAAICRASFFEFVKEHWDIVVARDLIPNWHIKYLCDSFQILAERVFLGMPKEYDLVTNVPPGSTKSTIMSICSTPWLWTRDPTMQTINGSNADELALDFSRKARDIIGSEKYKKMFPGIELRDDQNTKGHFVNTKGGARYAVGVGTNVIGKHAHFLIIDDPIDPMKAQSELEMKSVNRWMAEQLSQRKVEKSVTPLVLIMQRLSKDDPSGVILERGINVKHICLPASIRHESVKELVRPKELIENYKDGLLDPIRLTQEVLDTAYKELGPHGFCTPGFTPILMSNWREKRIEDVQIGDEVVGYVVRKTSGSCRLGRVGTAYITKARVLDKSVSFQKVYKLTLKSGRVAFCTRDHRWWTRRYGYGRKTYIRAEMGRHLFSVYTPFVPPTAKQQRWLDWLGGLLDGEGTIPDRQLCLSQSPNHNPEVCSRLEKVLNLLGIPFGYHTRKPHLYKGRKKDGGWYYERKDGGGRQYWLCGGRSLKVRVLSCCKMAKSKRILDSIWKHPHQVSENGGKDRIVKIEPVGKMKVYGLTTTTGNYVAWGYASENSGQFDQNPIPAGGGMFDVTRLNLRPVPPLKFKWIVRYWDKASAIVAKSTYTVGVKMGLDLEGHFWILDVIRGRWIASDRERLIVNTARLDGKQVTIGVEQEGGSGGKDSAEDTARRLAGYRVRIDKPTQGEGKIARSEPFSVQVNTGNVYVLERPWLPDLLSEMRYFPLTRYKDQCDGCAGAFTILARPRVRVGAL